MINQTEISNQQQIVDKYFQTCGNVFIILSNIRLLLFAIGLTAAYHC